MICNQEGKTILDEMKRYAEAVASAKDLLREYATEKGGIKGAEANAIADLIVAAESRGHQVGYDEGYADGLKAAQKPSQPVTLL